LKNTSHKFAKVLKSLNIIRHHLPRSVLIMSKRTISVTLGQLAKLIDHSLLHPTMTDEEIEAGLKIAKNFNVGAACIKPYSIPVAKRLLDGTDVLICSVIGFPHGNSTTAIKVTEATEAVKAGAHEIDMVVNVGKVLGGDWEYVEEEIKAINNATVHGGATLKVIFENDYLKQEHIIRLCEICTRVGVAFVKTSTGYGFVKQDNGMYSYKGATIPHLKLMKEHCGPGVQIKAAGGVRTLDEFLYVMSLGVTRVGASATVAIMEEAKKRGISDAPAEVQLKDLEDTHGGGY
jgi:deoxyribose-phosphate aldolase